MEKSGSSNIPSDLLHNFKEHYIAVDDYMSGLIDLIEPKYYFDKDTVEKLTKEVHEKIDEKVKGSKKKVSVHVKHRLARLDPTVYKTVSQVIQEEETEGRTEKQVLKKLRRQRKKMEKAKKASTPTLHSVALDRASNLDQLKHRLSEKIQAMKGNRKTPGLIESREERKAKKLAEKKGAKKKNKASKAGSETTEPVNTFIPKSKPGRPAPIFNKEGKMVFSKFDLADTGVLEAEDKRHHPKLTTNQPKKLMHKLDMESKKMKVLEETDPVQAQELKQRKQWLKAMDKVQGIKVRDDRELLKKSLKRQQKLKKQSKKKWQSRTEHVEQKQKERQTKRTENIKARKQAKLQTKMKKLKKKGRIIPGF